MQQLLDDRDLHQIALDEENAEEPVEYDLDIQDIVDLVEELGRRRTARRGSGHRRTSDPRDTDDPRQSVPV